MDVREEVAADRDAVRTVIEAAFGGTAEAGLVDALRRDGDVEISLVAVDGDAVVGHILLSRMTAPVRALGLAPVSVMPNRQGRGVGSRLIEDGLTQAKARGWEAVFVLGEPDYYSRFGFRTDSAEVFASPFAGPYFMARELVDGALEGRHGDVGYAPAFDALE
ncbi:MAG: GNAT family N-acetyltransferase [Alphaproteobacteria bacterium]|nr:GNAT family N-acetyltransferase [Alphaproteobacteria bacterium]